MPSPGLLCVLRPVAERGQVPPHILGVKVPARWGTSRASLSSLVTSGCVSQRLPLAEQSLLWGLCSLEAHCLEHPEWDCADVYLWTWHGISSLFAVVRDGNKAEPRLPLTLLFPFGALFLRVVLAQG